MVQWVLALVVWLDSCASAPLWVRDGGFGQNCPKLIGSGASDGPRSLYYGVNLDTGGSELMSLLHDGACVRLPFKEDALDSALLPDVVLSDTHFLRLGGVRTDTLIMLPHARIMKIVDLAFEPLEYPWPYAVLGSRGVGIGTKMFVHGGSRDVIDANISLAYFPPPYTYVLDLETMAWSNPPSLVATEPPFRVQASVVRVDDCMYYFGGLDENQAPTNDLWILNSTSMEWRNVTQTGEIPTPRQDASMSFFEDSGGFRLIILMCGISETYFLGVGDYEVHVMVADTYEWTRFAIEVPPTSAGRTVLVQSGSMLFAYGGYYVGFGTFFAPVEGFDLLHSEWTGASSRLVPPAKSDGGIFVASTSEPILYLLCKEWSDDTSVHWRYDMRINKWEEHANPAPCPIRSNAIQGYHYRDLILVDNTCAEFQVMFVGNGTFASMPANRSAVRGHCRQRGRSAFDAETGVEYAFAAWHDDFSRSGMLVTRFNVDLWEATSELLFEEFVTTTGSRLAVSDLFNPFIVEGVLFLLTRTALDSIEYIDGIALKMDMSTYVVEVLSLSIPFVHSYEVMPLPVVVGTRVLFITPTQMVALDLAQADLSFVTLDVPVKYRTLLQTSHIAYPTYNGDMYLALWSACDGSVFDDMDCTSSPGNNTAFLNLGPASVYVQASTSNSLLCLTAATCNDISFAIKNWAESEFRPSVLTPKFFLAPGIFGGFSLTKGLHMFGSTEGPSIISGGGERRCVVVTGEGEAILEHIVFDGCYAVGDGSAIHVVEGKVVVRDFVMRNIAGRDGAAIFNSRASVHLQRGTFLNVSSERAAIYAAVGDIVVEDCTFMDLKSTVGASAVHCSASSCTISGSTFRGNRGVTGTLLGFFSDVTVQDSVFEGNFAEIGGGIVADAESSFLIHASSIAANVAMVQLPVRALGGGVRCRSSSIIFTSSNLTFNKVVDGDGAVAGLGGAVHSVDCVLSFYSSTLRSNEAQIGGALHVQQGSLSLMDSSVSSNTALLDGGGAYLSSVPVAVQDSRVDDNVANRGGGLAAVSGLDSAVVQIHGGGLAGNTAAVLGGAVAVFGFSQLNSSSHMTGNAAAVGGGVYWEPEFATTPVIWTGSGNTATSYGPDAATPAFKLSPLSIPGVNQTSGDRVTPMLTLAIEDYYAQLLATDVFVRASVTNATVKEDVRASLTGIINFTQLRIVGAPGEYVLTASTQSGVELSEGIPIRLRDCTPGEYLSELLTCAVCQPGSYTADFNEEQCTRCPVGFAQSQPGMRACDACPPGYHAPLEGLDVCLEAPLGAVQSEEGQLSKSATTIIVSLLALLGLTLMVAVLFAVLSFRKRQKRTKRKRRYLGAAADGDATVKIGDANIAQYIVESLEDESMKMIGAGGFAKVYKMELPASEEFVATKVLTNLGSDELADFHRELDALTHLAGAGGHTNIVECKFWVEDMDLQVVAIGVTLCKMTLHEYVRLKKNSSDDVLKLRCLTKMVRAVAFMHCNGLAHLDLKPKNALVGDNDNVLLADFGTSVKMTNVGVAADSEADFMLVGTPQYISPERMALDAAESSVDLRLADVYSLAIAMWAVLVVQDPFDGMRANNIMKRVKGSDTFRPPLDDVTHECARDFLSEGWQTLPASRPSARDLAKRMNTCLEECFNAALPEDLTLDNEPRCFQFKGASALTSEQPSQFMTSGVFGSSGKALNTGSQGESSLARANADLEHRVRSLEQENARLQIVIASSQANVHSAPQAVPDSASLEAREPPLPPQ